LAALALGFALADPAVLDKAAQEWVDEIVMHLGLARDHAHLFFEGIPVLGTREQSGQEH
jgi:hypothetical protein